MSDSITWQNELLMSRPENKSAENINCFEKPDACLVELVLAGDETAFEDIFERYKRFVAIIAGRYFQRPEQVEEIIQISFTKAFFELKDFRGKHDFSMASWLGKITTNTCLDTLKKQKRKAENLISELSDAENKFIFANLTDKSGNAENNLVGRDLAEKLLSRLPPADRALLQMLYTEEMSVDEISLVTGRSSSNIKVRAHRARAALRKVLGKFL